MLGHRNVKGPLTRAARTSNVSDDVRLCYIKHGGFRCHVSVAFRRKGALDVSESFTVTFHATQNVTVTFAYNSGRHVWYANPWVSSISRYGDSSRRMLFSPYLHEHAKPSKLFDFVVKHLIAQDALY